MKTLFIVLVLLVFSSGLGGAYYYFEIFQPKVYAKAVVALFGESGVLVSLSDTAVQRVATTSDYAGSLEVLEEKTESLKITKENLLKLKPPRKMRGIHQDLLGYLDFFILTITGTEERAKFFAKLFELNSEIKKLFQSLQTEKLGEPPNIKKIQDFWKIQVPKISLLGEKIFKGEAIELKEISFEELKSKWLETSQGLSTLLSFILLFNPNLPPEEVGSSLTPEQNRQAEETMRGLEGFVEILDSQIQKNSAIDIIFLGHLTSSQQVEMSERSFKVYNIIQNFKKISAQ